MTGQIPRKFIDDLLARTDIVEVIDARVPLRKAGKDYKACCPFHSEKTPSFTVSTDKQFYHCFGCGAHGSAIGFLMEYERQSFVEAVEELAARAGLEVPREGVTGAGRDPRPVDQLGPLYDTLTEADRLYRRWLRDHPRAGEATGYLKGRGVSGETAAAFGLGYAPEGWDNLTRALGTDEEALRRLVAAGLATRKEGGGHYDRLRHRLLFPIHDARGRIAGFGGRVLGEGEPKYLNSPETAVFHKGRELYGLYRAREALRRESRVLVVEGYMDVVMLAQYGVDFAVATLGTATTREHLERLYRHVPEVIYCFDGDRAGREAAWRALEQTLPEMHEGRQASFLFLPEGEDPDSLIRREGRDAFLARLAQAEPLPDYFFRTLAARVDLTRLDGRARLTELARPHLAGLTPGVFRTLMVGRLAEICRLSPQALSTLLQGGAARPGSGPAETPPVRTARATARPPTRSGGLAGVPSGDRYLLVRMAIACLVQHPGLAGRVVEVEIFRAIDRPGVDLLMELLRLLKDRPDLSPAAVLEHYRDTPHERALAKLLVWDHPALRGEVEPEFDGLMRNLRREALCQRLEVLAVQRTLTGLSDGEKAEFRRLEQELRVL